MAYSLRSFMNSNQGQQSATSFTQPIKMPLSQTVLRKGIGQSTPLSAVGQVPWSGEGQSLLGGSMAPESVSDLAESTSIANANADNPATIGEAIGKGAIVGGLFAGGLPAAAGVAGMVVAGGKVANAIRGMYQSKTEPTFIQNLIDVHMPKIMHNIFGEPEGQNPNPDIPGLEYGGVPNMHGEAAVESGQVAPVEGGYTPIGSEGPGSAGTIGPDFGGY